jgi:antitoxin (DNA-binding transcriptional repressor) of toxin-antitoxin stability system
MDRRRTFKFLKAVDVRDAVDSLGDYVSQLEGQPLVVMDGDMPLAAIVPVHGLDLEDLSIGSDPDFRDFMEESRRRARDQGTLTTDEVRREFGLPERQSAGRD